MIRKNTYVLFHRKAGLLFFENVMMEIERQFMENAFFSVKNVI